jgi:hypothetical protein
LYLNAHCVHEYELKKQTEYEWEGEPDGIVWSFELKENRILFIKAEYYEDLYNKDISQIVIKTEYPYDDFLRNVVIEVDSLIKRHGIIGYREEWNDSDFTLSTFLKLRKLDHPSRVTSLVNWVPSNHVLRNVIGWYFSRIITAMRYVLSPI